MTPLSLRSLLFLGLLQMSLGSIIDPQRLFLTPELQQYGNEMIAKGLTGLIITGLRHNAFNFEKEMIGIQAPIEINFTIPGDLLPDPVWLPSLEVPLDFDFWDSLGIYSEGSVSACYPRVNGLSSLSDNMVNVSYNLVNTEAEISLHLPFSNVSVESSYLLDWLLRLNDTADPEIPVNMTMTGDGLLSAGAEDFYITFGAKGKLPLTTGETLSLDELQVDFGFSNLFLFAENALVNDVPYDADQLADLVEALYRLIWENEGIRDSIVESVRCTIHHAIKDCVILDLIGGVYECLDFSVNPECTGGFSESHIEERQTKRAVDYCETLEPPFSTTTTTVPPKPTTTPWPSTHSPPSTPAPSIDPIPLPPINLENIDIGFPGVITLAGELFLREPGLHGLSQANIEIHNFGFNREVLELDVSLNMPNISLESNYETNLEIGLCCGADDDLVKLIADGTGCSFAGLQDFKLDLNVTAVVPISSGNTMGLEELYFDFEFSDLMLEAENLLINSTEADFTQIEDLLKQLYELIWNDDSKPVVTEMIRCSIDYAIQDCVPLDLIGGVYDCIRQDLNPVCFGIEPTSSTTFSTSDNPTTSSDITSSDNPTTSSDSTSSNSPTTSDSTSSDVSTDPTTPDSTGSTDGQTPDPGDGDNDDGSRLLTSSYLILLLALTAKLV